MTALRNHPAGLIALLLALTIQAFAPDWAALVMRATGPAGLANADICHADAPEQPPQDRQQQPSPHAPCPVCQAFAAVQTLLAGAAVPSPSPTLPPRRLRRRQQATVQIRSAGIRPRARSPPRS